MSGNGNGQGFGGNKGRGGGGRRRRNGRNRNRNSKRPTWACPQCGFANFAVRTVCLQCSAECPPALLQQVQQLAAQQQQQKQQQQQQQPRQQQQQQQQQVANPGADLSFAQFQAAQYTGMGPSHPDPSTPYMTSSLFANLRNVSPLSLRAIAEVMRYQCMTRVQEQTLPTILQGHDVLAKAKTGTGKTLGFLIPSVEQLVRQPTPNRSDIGVLVLSPTRELAEQIRNECRALLSFHQLGVEHVVGGTNVNAEKKRIASRPCDVLVATPGRLEDHLQNTPGFRQRLNNIRVLVLDEADQLLEAGFRPAIERIVGQLPKTRQTLLFTATVPKVLHSVVKVALKPKHVFMDTLTQEEKDTIANVRQTYCVVPFENVIGTVYTLICEHMQAHPHDHKIMVFFTTARLTQYYAQLFTKAGINCMEIHSRKTQKYRTRTSAAFRGARSGVLFSSDVSARGVDYPNVSLIVQVGVASSREQYVHRLGRTARAGKSGEGVLVLAPFEQFFLKDLKDLPLVARHPLPECTPTNGVNALSSAMASVSHGDANLAKCAEMAYQSWLGFYNGLQRRMGWSPTTLVQHANRNAQLMGLTEQPGLLKRTIGKMGLRNVPGLRIKKG